MSPHKCGWFLPDKKYIQIKWKVENAYESSEGKIIPRVATVSSFLSIVIPECSVNILFRWIINLHREIIWADKPSYIWSISTLAQCPWHDDYGISVVRFPDQFYVNFKGILDYNQVLWANMKCDIVIFAHFYLPTEAIGRNCHQRNSKKFFSLLQRIEDQIFPLTIHS